jgi:hypothetical protein
MKKLLLSCVLALLFTNLTFAQEDAIKDSMEVFFDLDRATLKKDSKDSIMANFERYKERLLKMRVTGFTCDIGSDNYNMGLSERRAQSAFEFIQTLGEYQDRSELFFYGEKIQKYDTRPENRRVHVLLYLEDDDIDTLIKESCAEVFIEKKSFAPAKNKKMNFTLKAFESASAMKSNNLEIMDTEGRKLYFNSVMYFKASMAGTDMTAKKNLKIKLPIVNEDKPGYTFYTGEDQGGSIVWKNTGKPCVLSEEGACKTYNLDWMLDGYCACAKPRKCEEDCNPDPFSGTDAPDLTKENIKASNLNTVAEFAPGTYASYDDVAVEDDLNFNLDLSVCEQFEYGITTDDWFPIRYSVVNPKKNIIVSSSLQPNRNNTTRIYVDKKEAGNMDNPVLLPGKRFGGDKYVMWESEKVDPTPCVGEANCDYIVYDVVASGLYKLTEWKDAAPQKAADKYILKVRLLKNSKVFVGNKATGEVYLAKNATRKGKVREKEYAIRDFDNAGDIVVYIQNTTKKLPMYQEVKLSDLKYKKAANMYVARLVKFNKVQNFDNIEFTECK